MNEAAGVTLGLDIGTVRTGVARADALGLLAHPVKTLRAESVADLVSQLKALVEEEGACRVVVGLPKNLHGGDSAQAGHVRTTIAQLKTLLPTLDVVWADERFTTRDADRRLIALGRGRKRRKATRDQLAAVLILQTWLDAR